MDSDGLLFVGPWKPASTNDLLSTVTDLSFASGVGAFTLGGRSLTATNDLLNLSGSLQTINMPIIAGGNGRTWFGGTGGVQLRGGLTLGNRTLTLTNNFSVTGTDLVVGGFGSATLNLNTNSRASFQSTSLAAASVSDVGQVLVTGEGTTWSSAALSRVGQAGFGSLAVRGGAIAALSGLSLGTAADSDGSAVVSGVGSELRRNDALRDRLVVGGRGRGGLAVVDGGVVDAPITVVGEYAGSIGGVLVRGKGSVLKGTVIVAAIGAFSVGGRGNASASFDVLGGGKMLGDLWMGDFAGSTVTSRVQGSGSVIQGRAINIGSLDSGNVRLDVTDGGALLGGVGIQGQRTTLVLSGAGSRIDSGADGCPQANLVVRNGARVVTDVANVGGYDRGRASSPIFAGTDAMPGIGVMTVTGAGSSFESRTLFIADFGQGTLNVAAGGQVRAQNIELGGRRDEKDKTPTQFLGHGLVIGAGSRMEALQMRVGANGRGHLTIANGGVATISSMLIADEIGIGQGTIQGQGSRWDGNDRTTPFPALSRLDMAAGPRAVASLRILDGAQAAGSDGFISVFGTASVVVDGAGSALSFRRSLQLGSRGGSATVELRRGGNLSAPALSVGRNALIQIDGGSLFTQNLTLAGGRIETTGVLDLRTASTLSGVGTVVGRIQADALQLTVSGGSLSLGDAGLAGAVVLGASRLNLGSQLLLLQSADEISLGEATLLGAGARLNAPGGVAIERGRSLVASGGATIDAAAARSPMARRRCSRWTSAASFRACAMTSSTTLGSSTSGGACIWSSPTGLRPATGAG